MINLKRIRSNKKQQQSNPSAIATVEDNTDYNSQRTTLASTQSAKPPTNEFVFYATQVRRNG